MTKIINVNIKDNEYKIIIGYETLNSINQLHKKYFPKKNKVIIYDKKLQNSSAYNILLNKLGKNTQTISVPSGEESKSIHRLEIIYNKLFKFKIDRNTVIYAFGGGVIGDLAGFASATVMRGIDYVQIPTTLLSQIDSSVGGKTAINSKYGKNLIGSFHQPKLVLIDIKTLNSLSKNQMISGYAEMVKYSLINDEKFFTWLEKNGKFVLEKNTKKLEYSIHKCCKIKVKIVEKDEKEKSKRALLNLGHTFAHALERVSNYKGFTHGEAVSVGLILAFKLSYRFRYCNLQDLNRVTKHFDELKLPKNISDIMKQKPKSSDIVSAMKLDKKTINDIINFILAKGIGKAFKCATVKEKPLKLFLDENISL